jgi:hypothetical protein
MAVTGRGIAAPDYRREAREVLARLLQYRAAYTPAWTAAEGDPGRAVLASYASMVSLLWERLNQAPDKNKLQFLADLGIDSLPPAAARAPVVLEPLGGNALAPAGSLVGATSPDGQPLTFRTESGIGLSASPLAEVWSVVPQGDTIGSHSVEIAGGRDAALFLEQSATDRFLFVGHSQLFAFDGESAVELEIEFREPSRSPLAIAWSTWDGTSWREFADIDVEDRTLGMTVRGTIRIKTHCVKAARTAVDGVESFWLRGELRTALTPDPARRLPIIDQLRVRTSINTSSAGQSPDSVVAAGVVRDPQEPIEPFGSQPRATSVFYAAWDSILARSDASVSLTMDVTRTVPTASPAAKTPTLAWEYWDGGKWKPLPDASVADLGANGTAAVKFTVKPDLQPADVNGLTAHWIRARIESGSYDQVTTLTIGAQQIEVRTAFPPTLNNIKMSVEQQTRLAFPEQVFAQNSSGFRDGTAAVRFRGTGFQPFLDNPDRTPAVYFGFDGELPAASIGMYFEVGSAIEGASHEFRWEHFDGQEWVSLPVEDETAHLTKTGIVRLLWPGNRVLRRVAPVAASGDTATTLTSRDANLFVPGEQLHLKEGETGELAVVSSITGRSIRFRRPLTNSFQNASLSQPEPALFGVPRTWIRARLTEGEPPMITVRRLLINAVWASESVTIEREILGSGTNLPGQLFQSARTPILEGEIVQVRELSGARARTDLVILQRELTASGRNAEIETDLDAEGRIVAAWVTWQRVTNLRSSTPDDRHYVVDRARGRVVFGDGVVHGRAAPTGNQNVRLRRYTTGGGRAGNVAESAITTPLSGIIARRVWNPVAATGGAEAEPADRAATRAPRILRHRYQAVSAADYRDIAVEASPEVFDAAVVRMGDDLGGSLRLLVLPWSDASPPAPSAQLLESVRRHVSRRCAASAASRLRVQAPTFVEVGVDVELAPASFDVAGQVFDRVRAAIVDHLHPVRGGPQRLGWRFGSTVHVAGFAPVLESTEGVDFVTSISVTVRGAMVGDVIVLAADELPAPGTIRVTLTSVGGS